MKTEMLFNKLKQRLAQVTPNQWTFFLAMCFILTGVTVKSMESPPTPATESHDEPGPADTLIPKNHVLVPIEVVNQESLNGLIGSFASVDLFAVQKASDETGSIRKGRKIASHVKLIRAPLNPQKFAVLVHERQSEAIVSYQGEFFVILQQRGSEVGTMVHPAKQVQKTSAPEISYQSDE